MKSHLKSLLASALLAGGVLVGTPAVAGLTLLTYDFEGTPPPNDCSGLFGGSGGVVCDVGYALNPSQEISPIVAKWDLLSSTPTWEIETNPGFSSVDGNEFDVLFGSAGLKSGTWSYIAGVDDPVIRYWVAKDGGGFKLHWMVDDSELSSGGDCSGSPLYSLDCLTAAQAVTGGSFSTLGQDLSHITWYDTDGDDNGGGGGGAVPEPATLALVGLGLLGAAVARRRQRG